jgi:hypothetical protein
MKSTEDIKTFDGIVAYVEGLLNDYDFGFTDRTEARNVIIDLVMKAHRSGQLKKPISSLSAIELKEDKQN